MGEIIALLCALSYAISYLMIRKGTTHSSQDNGAFISILLTAGLSGIIVLGMALVNGFPTLNSPGFFWFILAGILTSFLGRVLSYSSFQYLGSVRASSLKRLIPFFAVIIGVLFLNETITLEIFLGMILIFCGFFLILRQSYQSFKVSRKNLDTTNEENEVSLSTDSIKVKYKEDKRVNSVSTESFLRSITTLGYIVGVISALLYAIGIAVRKKGLTEIPDPFIGTLIGAGIGILIFVFMALFKDSYKVSVKLTFSDFNSWLFFAGLATSVGQILYFLALNYISVSRTALIVSTDAVITMFLTAWIFKIKEQITITVILGSLVTMLGAAIITLS